MEQPSKKIIAERNIWAQPSYRQQNEQVQWRRTKVQEIRSKGYSQREISQILLLGLATVRDYRIWGIKPNLTSENTLDVLRNYERKSLYDGQS